jgi:hypothetical protein
VVRLSFAEPKETGNIPADTTNCVATVNTLVASAHRTGSQLRTEQLGEKREYEPTDVPSVPSRPQTSCCATLLAFRTNELGSCNVVTV